MAAIGTAGTSGTRNPGALRLSPRRNATTEACTNANKPRNARLARIAIVSIVRKTRKPAPTNVRATAAGGTSRPPMRAKLPGRRRSRAMLNEVLIAAVRFEFKAPYIETIPMINTTALTYGPPTKCRMHETAMSSDPPRQPPHAGHPDCVSLGTFPSTAKKKPPYTRNASKSARNTPLGTLLSGCFTWSDSCATTSKPWKAMKRTPAPSIKSSDETGGAERRCGHVATPREPAAHESARRGQRAPHPDVRAARSVGPARCELGVRHAGEGRDERGDGEAQQDEGSGDRVCRADQEENRGADHRSKGRHRDVEQAEVPGDSHANGSRPGSGTGHGGAENGSAT